MVNVISPFIVRKSARPLDMALRLSPETSLRTKKKDWDHHKSLCFPVSEYEKKLDRMYRKFLKFDDFWGITNIVATFIERKVPNEPRKVRMLALIMTLDDPDEFILKVITIKIKVDVEEYLKEHSDKAVSVHLIDNYGSFKLLAKRFIARRVVLGTNDNAERFQERGHILRHKKRLADTLKQLLGIERMDLLILYSEDIHLVFRIINEKLIITSKHY